MFDATKVTTGNIELEDSDFGLNKFLREYIDDMAQTTTTHTIENEFGESVRLYADRSRLGQVVSNLVSNAIKYSPDADRIVVRSEVREADVVVSVEDFGDGLSGEDQKRIFDRFFRTESVERRSFSGVGLGLYIASGIIARHGGKIWVESELGKGSTFFFSLPLHHEGGKKI